MLVVIRRARLAEILQYPDLLFTGLDVRLGIDPSEAAQCPKAIIRPRASSMEHGIIGMWIFRHDTPDVSMHCAIHWTVECFVSLDATIEEPTPW